MDKSRRQFEEEFRNNSPKSKIDIFRIDENTDDYCSLFPRIAWRYWKASRESLEIELPKEKDTHDSGEFNFWNNGYNNGILDCENILIRNGVKIKNE